MRKDKYNFDLLHYRMLNFSISFSLVIVATISKSGYSHKNVKISLDTQHLKAVIILSFYLS